jgi:hypothetical protein
MRGFTLTQPWASLVASGHKRVETRNWRTNYTGPIAIHAAKGFPKDAQYFASEERAFGRITGNVPLSAIVAVGRLIGCRFTQDVAAQLTVLERRLGDYTPGRYAWFLSDIVALPEPMPCRGALGLWYLSAEITEQLQERLGMMTT